jgi:hypothetical protein
MTPPWTIDGPALRARLIADGLIVPREPVPWTIFRNRERLPVLRLEPDFGASVSCSQAPQRPHLVSEFVGGAALFSGGGSR